MIPIKRFDGKIVGKTMGTTFYTHRYADKHFYIIGQGYPIGDDILQRLKAKGIKRIFIMEHLSNGKVKHWKTDIETYLRAPIIQHPPFEKQRCVSLGELCEF